MKENLELIERLTLFFYGKLLEKGGYMDIDRFVKDLLNNEELKDVPISYIGRVALVVLKLIQGNKYIYKIDE